MDNRLCELCDFGVVEVEDEIHFVLYCPIDDVCLKFRNVLVC